MPMRGRSRGQRSSRCCCSAIQCASRSLTDASATACMPIGVRKAISSLLPGSSHRTGLQSRMKDTPCTRKAPAVKLLSPKDDRTTLEQMYLITVLKISVLAPNCWETLTEFSCYKNRTGTQRRFSPLQGDTRLFFFTQGPIVLGHHSMTVSAHKAAMF